MSQQRLTINPQIFKWLKKEFQLSDVDIAKKMGIKKVENYIKIEEGITKPTLIQVRRLSKTLKIPLMVFYLKRQPDGKELPIDYRNKIDSSLSVKSILAIRRGYLIQDLMLSFSDEQQFQLQHLSNLKPIEVAQTMRNMFKYSPQDRINPDDLFTQLRTKIESLGVITLALSLDRNDLRGFSLIGQLPVIAVASADAKSSQIFTLLHELFHVIKRQTGLCQPLTSGLGSIEAQCNQFASNFLITPTELKQALIEDDSTEDANLRRIANQFKTSREVILIKMIEQGLATWKEYEKKSEVWQEEYKNQKSFGRQADPIRKAWRENGHKVTQRIFNQLTSEDMTQSEAAHYLNIKASYIDFIGERQMSRL
ncbi:MAG: XRE family transcriptional regulator [Candidatus Saccharibacteria bacterium]|nr:XRE family transcriptional regulator [Candidatus Saccharibacteria bacterium]MCY4088979.1 XRE family transcriptional regulator [Candidatus Saccharibacteria bacterium]